MHADSGRGVMKRIKDNREARCKLCKRSIYVGQPRTWVRGEVIGLVHEECLDSRG